VAVPAVAKAVAAVGAEAFLVVAPTLEGELTLRPDYGSNGTRVLVRSNFFEAIFNSIQSGTTPRESAVPFRDYTMIRDCAIPRESAMGMMALSP
jgi:hypothetical protein